jgi:DNA-binding NarL/FixJ family response regulator/predicted Ser/Thr protein kinase
MDRREDFRRREAPADAFAPRTRARSRRGTGRPERGRAPKTCTRRPSELRRAMSTEPATGADLACGTEVAGYRIESLLGRGGMGVVYLATDLSLDRPVALKILPEERAQEEGFRERFLRESRLAASLDHPHIVPVFAAGEADGLLYIAMRYVEGTDLRALLEQEGRFDPARAIALVADVADALDAAHDRGLVHRDVKPANILISSRAGREHCYLADFGLTGMIATPSSLTQAGAIMGTLDYLAPEQIAGEAVDARTDLYSLACVLFESLDGKPPFARESAFQVLWAHMQDEPPTLRSRRPELPEALDAVLTTALAKEPADRFRTCGALVAAALGALEPGEAKSAAPGPTRATHAQAADAGAAAAGPSALRVVIADDSMLAREGLARLLGESGFGVLATSADATDLLRSVELTRPDVAIVDIKMPPTHTDEGLVAAQQIRRTYPEMGVLVLSQYLEPRYAMRLLEDFPERVGYLLKERVSDIAVLADALSRIAEGECVVDPTIVSRLVHRQRSKGPLAELSEREREVLALVAEGRSNEAVGEMLDLPPSAVESDLEGIFRKLGLTESPDSLRRVIALLGYLRS